ncbi:hypothetical protein AAEX63_16200 [Luteococcus sp. H138]|uniref:hypothetical protein n=1 Tax=unclassified Luteococcus TaxID=2639923 RepID=UPI00313BD754
MTNRTATSANPYFWGALPITAYSAAAITAVRTNWLGEDTIFVTSMAAAIAALLALAVWGFMKQRRSFPRLSMPPARAAIFAVVVALALATNPSKNVQVMVHIATCFLIVAEVARIHQRISSQEALGQE